MSLLILIHAQYGFIGCTVVHAQAYRSAAVFMCEKTLISAYLLCFQSCCHATTSLPQREGHCSLKKYGQCSVLQYTGQWKYPLLHAVGTVR